MNKNSEKNGARAAFRLFCIAAMTFYYLVKEAAGSIYRRGQRRRSHTLRCFGDWSAALLRVLDIRVRKIGEAPGGPALLTPNHQGYLDILVLASLTPLTFVAKSEVRAWPVVGFLVRRGGQLTVKRGRSKDLVNSLRSVRELLRTGESVCVFLEGTSTGRGRPGKFHPSLLQPAVDLEVEVIPTAIHWSADDSSVEVSEDVAYWGSHRFAPHLWRLMGLSGIKASVQFGKPMNPEGRSRHDLAEALHVKVSDMLQRQVDSSC